MHPAGAARARTAAALLLATAATGRLSTWPAPAAPGGGALDATALLQLHAAPGAGAPRQQGAQGPRGGGRPAGLPAGGVPGEEVLGEAGRPAGSGRPSGQRPLRLAAAPPEVHLLTSLVLRGSGHDHPHVREMLAASQANLGNPYITSVHVLLEAPGRSGGSCAALPAAMQSATGMVVSPSSFGKMTCRMWSRQPTYADLFRYANSSMSRAGNIVLANADVVFDETLRRMKQLQPGSQGHLISVRAPEYAGDFKAIWHTPCKTVLNKCSRETHSWDAYAFSLPLSPKLLGADLAFTMNILAADHRAAFALRDSGLTLTNPCMHINAFHWHCFSQKMHANFTAEYGDGSSRYSADNGVIKASYPCQDFPFDGLIDPECRQ